MIDYWLRFLSLENEEKFIKLAETKYEDYKKIKNMIKRKIESLIECLKRDSEDGIQDN